jgi:hypothetical protein
VAIMPEASPASAPLARIDADLVRTVLGEFPSGDWKTLRASSLRATGLPNLSRTWTGLSSIRSVGGNYVFLFPACHFEQEREISLDGPGSRKIPFRFSSRSHPPCDGLVVAYVGKAANLHQRFQWHFSLARRNTGAQVQYGLLKSGVCPSRSAAVEFMLLNAIIIYRTLPGDEHTANRDLLELSLCARFAPPFNIKSER